MESEKDRPERRAKAAEFWDEFAVRDPLTAIYDNDEVQAKGFDAFWQAGEEDARRLAWFFPPGGRVVEIGCGIGRIVRYLAPRCGEIIGVDISKEMIAQGKEALAEVSNVRWIQTNGASLEGIDDGSVDLVYSLLVMIHVDRRSAFRYLEEIRRVLGPNGLAFLQFQNIECPEGIAEMRRVLDLDYPLEFYTDTELRYLFAEVGLEVVASHADRFMLFYTLRAGSAEAWRDEIAHGITASDATPGERGSLSVTLSSTLERIVPLRLELAVTRGGRTVECVDAYVDVAPGANQLAIERAAPDASANATWRGDAVGLAPVPFPTGDGEPDGAWSFHISLLPAGCAPQSAEARAFPGLSYTWGAPA